MLKRKGESADFKCMDCPKCGFRQSVGEECGRCGIVFSKFSAARHIPVQKGPSVIQKVPGYALRLYRVFRWITLAVLILAIGLILRTSRPPVIVVPPDAVRSAQEKVQHFQTAAGSGGDNRLEMDQGELNGWLGENLALKREGRVRPQTQESLIDLAKTATSGRTLDDPVLQQAQSSVRDVKVELQNDRIHVYAIFDLHGKDMSLELEGRLLVQDGYLRLDPTGGKFGSLPLFAGTLRSAADRLFTSPENKEKFRLPPYIKDVRIENGYLVVTSEARNLSQSF